METLDKLEEEPENTSESKEKFEKPEENELIVQEYSFEQSAPGQGSKAEVTNPSGPQKLYPGVFMTPKPTYRKMSFAPGRTNPLIIGVKYCKRR